MKKIITFLMLVMIANSTFSQQNEPVPALSKQGYLKKSKNQKKAGMVLLALGTGMIITSVIVPKGEFVHDGICIWWFCEDENIKTME